MTSGIDGFQSLLLEVGGIIVVLWAALWYLMRRNRGVAAGATRDCEMVRQLAIGPKERLIVVRVGSRHLVLGVGSASVSLLCELNEPLPQAETGVAAFGDAVRKAAGRWRAG
jgi:flagellar protein FliO/FliZ